MKDIEETTWLAVEIIKSIANVMYMNEGELKNNIISKIFKKKFWKS